MEQKKKRRRYLPPLHGFRPGEAPGTLIGEPLSHPPKVFLIGIGAEEMVEEDDVTDLARITAMLEKYPTTWIHIEGLGQVELINQVGELLHLHPLALEDVLTMQQRTKTERYPEQLFTIIRIPIHDDGLSTQQLNIFIGKNFVVTIQDRRIGYLEPIRERIRKGVPRTRFLEADYLAYTIIDAAIDTYFPLLESYGDSLEEIEHVITTNNIERKTLSRIYSIKRDMQELRRAVWPQREAVNGLIREESELISSSTHLYLRDCYDHSIQLMDLTEALREFGSDLVNLYMSRQSNDMNAVMKVLTIIATIFIPLGFIAGVYGMNFNPTISPWNMPELNWYCGYPFALGLMGLSALIMLSYFWWKKWF